MKAEKKNSGTFDLPCSLIAYAKFVKVKEVI